MREFALILAMMALGVLIVLKSDQQSIHVLEGKLYKRGKATVDAKLAYQNHLHRSSLTLFVIGTGLSAMAIILWVDTARSLALLCGGLAIVLCALGIWGRVRSFMAADAELVG